MRQRHGIVLMMTLGFIAVITALILWSVSISKNRFDKVVEIDGENQVSIVLKDFVSLIKSIPQKEFETLLAMPTLPPIPEEKTKIGLGFSIKSYMDKLNLNAILKSIVEDERKNKTVPKELLRPLNKFFDTHELSNPYLFIDLLLAVSRGDSEIALEDFDFRVGKIYNFDHFKKIEDYYYENTQDENIYKISRDELERFFYFGENNDTAGGLDCQKDRDVGRNPYGALSLIVNDEMQLNALEDDGYCQELNTSNNPAMKTLNNIYNISQFANKKKYLVKCTLYLDVDNNIRNISFDYDVKTKRISNIDKNFQE